MKSISSPLLAHLQGDALTIAALWKVVRVDGVVIGFTNHDADLVFDDGDGNVTYKASTGFTPSATEHKADMSPDNVEVTGFMDVAAIDEADIRAHLYDGAVIRVCIVNYKDLTMGCLKLLKGTTGNIGMENGVFKVELRSITQKLTTQIGQVYGPGCRNNLGDARCTIDLSLWTQTTSVHSVTDARNIVLATGLKMIGSTTPTVDAPNGWFTDGMVLPTSGALNGHKLQIKKSVFNSPSAGYTAIEFMDAQPFAFAPGDTLNIEPGCNKDRKAGGCTKFSNIVNYNGENDIPGPNAAFDYPDSVS